MPRGRDWGVERCQTGEEPRGNPTANMIFLVRKKQGKYLKVAGWQLQGTLTWGQLLWGTSSPPVISLGLFSAASSACSGWFAWRCSTSFAPPQNSRARTLWGASTQLTQSFSDIAFKVLRMHRLHSQWHLVLLPWCPHDHSARVWAFAVEGCSSEDRRGNYPNSL